MKTTDEHFPNVRHRVSYPAGVAALAAVLLTLAGPAESDGALAIGLPDDVANDGVAFGYAVRSASQERASAVALQHCRTTRESTDKARALCKVVETFKGQCVVIAMDPQAGTPGVGWAIAPTKELAEQQAMKACRATEGENRRGACQISVSVCDKPVTR